MFTGLSGRGGLVRVAGRAAATLTDWSVRMDPATHEFIVSAGVTDAVPLYLSPRYPSEVRLQMTKRIWRWQGATVELLDDRITARVCGEPDVM